LRILRASTRKLPDAEPPETPDADVPSIDAALIKAERNAALRSALWRLPTRDQALLSMLVADREPSYREIGAALGMPIGSIGPTRGRALTRLRRQLEHGHIDLDLAA
jgi:DNA-directed RNA polymerase specialized sigma24 family protein